MAVSRRVNRFRGDESFMTRMSRFSVDAGGTDDAKN
jgi:hypothetical protein